MITTAQYTPCLDMLPVTYRASADQELSDDAVLLGIAQDGGQFHVEFAAPEGAVLDILLPQGEVKGVVEHCLPDEHHGFILDVRVDRRRDWLGARYSPAYLQRPAHTVQFSKAS